MIQFWPSSQQTCLIISAEFIKYYSHFHLHISVKLNFLLWWASKINIKISYNIIEFLAFKNSSDCRQHQCCCKP